ncbi:hypothetical protein [Nonomuraea lactucae]|uniref:recombination directionality factor n=1 Tax=Nonomuraea lactucae TaxID=2249762 RepID=UPI000DE43043|nr:hypothetical protein [Nonomuraea lactucae]
MPIINLQKRARELGRIRIGEVQPTARGGTRPAKLDRFRLTSASRALLDKVAKLYGGEVREWTPANGGPSAWEVITDATRLPILVPPQPVSQWYELWSGGGCKRRCDGQTEILSDSSCLCAQADEMLCKPTTRLNVVLRDVEGIGVFRLETHGYYAAVELPDVAAFLAQAGGYVAANLSLEERVVKRDGETRRFMVPTIEVEGLTPGELVAGGGRTAIGAGTAPAVAGASRTAIEAPRTDYEVLIAAAGSRDDVVKIWEQAKQDPNADGKQVEAAAKARVAELQQPAPAVEPAQEAPGSDAELLWQQIVSAWPRGMTELAKIFEGAMGIHHKAAAENELAAFLKLVKAGKYNGLAPATTPAGAEEAVPF